MGTAESRFREAVKNGDQSRAYELYYGKKLVRDSVDPGQRCYEDTGSCPVHYAALHAMEELYMEFLNNGQVSPLECNDMGQNSLHLICSRGRDQTVRCRMLQLTLNNKFVRENVARSLQLQDEDGNTVLHIAAEYGLTMCVELLLNAGADVLATNKEGHTPGDKATHAGHKLIAKKLETRVVFLPSLDPAVIQAVNEDDELEMTRDIPQAAMAMKNQELLSMKDMLLIETSQLLGVSLFVAEALLRNHDWSKEHLLEAWMTDPHASCEAAGVSMPNVLSADNIDDVMSSSKTEGEEEKEEVECGICCLPITEAVLVPCDHSFCHECWQQYLHGKILEGDVHNIVCPDYGCYHLVPVHVIERLVSREMAQRYLRFDIKAFVDGNPNIKWCPRDSCGQAVTRPQTDDSDLDALSPLAALSTPTTPTAPTNTASIVVHCGNDHYFCWTCGELPHAPCDCTEWSQWLKKVEQMETKLGGLTSSQQLDAATSQWIAQHSKPCPKCNRPIEKTAGCNHMQCSKCHHDFCWMCLLPWKEHNSATGGYFMCNRYKERERADSLLEQRRSETDKLEQLSHFLHYYKRYENHKHSLKLEESFLLSAKDKIEELARAAAEERAYVGSLQFVDDAVRELVLGRCVLIASYAHGYSILVRRVRDEFETLQGDLEENVEALAEVVAKPHLRKPRSEIIRITRLVRDKRNQFVKDVQEGIRVDSPQVPKNRVGAQLQRDWIRSREEEQQKDWQERRQLDEIMTLSRQEYEEEAKLKEDTELAILLSMQSHDGTTNVDNGSPADISLTPPITSSLPYHSASQTSASDVQWTPHYSHMPGMPAERPNNDDILHWRQTLIEGWNERPSSSSSSSSSSASTEQQLTGFSSALEYGPVYGEDEDLARAIALSLASNTPATQTCSSQLPLHVPDVWNNLDAD